MLLGAGLDEPEMLEALDRITADCALAPALIVHKPVRCEDEGSIHAAIARVLGRTKLTKLRLVGFGFTDGECNGSCSFQAIAEGINVSTTLAELAIEDCFFGEKSTELLKGLRIGTLAIGRVALAEPLGARRLFQAILDPRSTIKHVSLLRGCEFYHVQTFMPLVRDSKLESLEIDLGRGNKNLFTLVEQIPQMMIKALQFCIDGATEHDGQPVLQVGRRRLLEGFRRNMTIESLTITNYDHARNFWSPEERLLLQSYAEENREFNLLLREAGAMGNHVWPERIAAVNQRRNDSSTALFLVVKALAPNRGAFRFGQTQKRASAAV